MSNNYALCSNRINFVVIPSYIKPPCLKFRFIIFNFYAVYCCLAISIKVSVKSCWRNKLTERGTNTFISGWSKVLLKIGALKNFGRSTGKTSFLSLLLKFLSWIKFCVRRSCCDLELKACSWKIKLIWERIIKLHYSSQNN